MRSGQAERAIWVDATALKSSLFPALEILFLEFYLALKFLECHILLLVRLSLTVIVLFAFVRSLKRIAECKSSC